MTANRNGSDAQAIAEQWKATTHRVIVFRLAGQMYGLPLEAIQETIFLPLLSQPPGLPALLAGILNLRGVAVAVLRMDHLFGVPSQPPRLHTPLFVLRNSISPLALIIEEAVGIVSIPQSAIVPVPQNSSFNECTDGVAMCGQGNILILSPERILLKTEQQRVAELTALEQARLAELAEGQS